MKTAHLGQTQVAVTRLGIGLAPIAGLYSAVGDEQAYATVEAAWDHGIRFFDTAPFYGPALSERRAGHVLGGKPRAEYTLSTKVGRRLTAGGVGTVDVWSEPVTEKPYWDFSAEGARSSLAESLDRLGLDRVDVLHIHDPDDNYAEAVAGALPALVALRAEGRIGAVSVGMNQAEMLADFVRTGLVDCVLLAGRYTLLNQAGLKELLPLCASRGVSVIAAGVFNSGILAGGTTYDYGRRRRRSCRRWPRSATSATGTVCRFARPRCSSRSAIRRWRASWSGCAHRPRWPRPSNCSTSSSPASSGSTCAGPGSFRDRRWRGLARPTRCPHRSSWCRRACRS